MFQKIILLIALCSTVSSEIIGQQPDSLPKISTQWARPRKIDLHHIALDLQFDWTKKQAFSTASLTLSLFNPSNKITLDAAMLAIQSITLPNGKTLQFNYDGSDKDDALEILLDRTYKANEALIVKIKYHTNWVNDSDPNNLWGSFGKGIRFFEPISSDLRKRKQLWSMGEPNGNRYWFPSYDAPNDLRTSEFRATVEGNQTVISNGKLLETKQNKDGTRTFYWKMDTPYSNAATAVVVGEYLDLVQQYKGVALHNFSYPDEKEGTLASVERLPDMVKFFSEYTGLNYPFSSYSQVFVQDFPNWSGNATASTITENMVDDDRTHRDFFYLWDITEAETLAAQWFGNVLNCQDWSDIWLNKAFAHYFGELYNSQKNGLSEYQLYQVTYDHDVIYLGDWNSGVRHPVVTRNYDNALNFTSDNYATFRGSLVLRMLHKYMGDENWKKAIQYYVKNNAHKLVTTEDFRKAIEATSGEPMDWFFDQWLYKMGHPIFEITKSYDDATKQLTLLVKQTQKIDTKNRFPQVDFFKGKVDIEIDDKIERVWLDAKAENIVTFKVENEPKLVNFDYESAWIKEISFQKSLDEYLFQFQHDKDILGKHSAMKALFAIAKNEKTSAEDKEKIYAQFRNAIQSKEYWRFRVNVLGQLQTLLAPTTSPAKLDETTISMLQNRIKEDKAWNKTSAIRFLGKTENPVYADIYIDALNDESDRVINVAAIALGQSKSPKALEALEKLVKKPSWKNQSLISALYGMKALGDARAYDTALKALLDVNSAHWSLATPVWDYRMTAVETIVALGKSEAAYPELFKIFKNALTENDLYGTFYNLMLLNSLADPRGKEAYELLKIKFKNDTNIMTTISQYEAQYQSVIKK